MSDDALRAFVQSATRQMRGEPAPPAPPTASYEGATATPFIYGARGSVPEPDDQPAEADPDTEVAPAFNEHQLGAAREAADDWLASLGDLDRTAAKADPEFAETSYRAWLAEQTDPTTAAGLLEVWQSGALERPALDDLSLSDEGERVARILGAGKPFPGPALVQRVLGDPAALGFDEDQARQWLRWAASTPTAEWEAQCAETGWDPGDRPHREDLPRDLQMQIAQQVLDEHAAAIRDGDRPPLRFG